MAFQNLWVFQTDSKQWYKNNVSLKFRETKFEFKKFPPQHCTLRKDKNWIKTLKRTLHKHIQCSNPRFKFSNLHKFKFFKLQITVWKTVVYAYKEPMHFWFTILILSMEKTIKMLQEAKNTLFSKLFWLLWVYYEFHFKKICKP